NVKVINKAQETVKAVSNGDIKTTEISVLVKRDSSYKDIKDLDGKQFGILKTIDRENTDFMLNRLSSQFINEISKIEYKEFKDEMKGLLEG
ncbi:LytR family transcriptional regulator, partial [Erysipelatoclostridium ramosum]|nr:LytR family transcriptional regulator [Thomasclavelia ramosa]